MQACVEHSLNVYDYLNNKNLHNFLIWYRHFLADIPVLNTKPPSIFYDARPRGRLVSFDN